MSVEDKNGCLHGDDGKFIPKGATQYRQNTSYAEILKNPADLNVGNESLFIKSGALVANSPRAVRHSIKFYNQVAKRTTDHIKIANLMRLDVNFTKEIKDYIFVPTKTINYTNSYGDNFSVCYYQAESWRRLSEGNPIEMDIVFIKHEELELKLRKSGMDYDSAHRIAEKKYNYKEAIDKWEKEYGKDKKKRRRKE